MSLVARYERVRRPRPVAGEPQRVFVLSRVTLGADVAVTSVMLAAAKRRFPNAEIVFVGPAQELGTVRRRSAHPARSRSTTAAAACASAWPSAAELKATVRRPGRHRDRSRFAPHPTGPAAGVRRRSATTSSKAAPTAATSDRSLARTGGRLGRGDLRHPRCEALRCRWRRVPEKPPTIAVSLGVGENPAKRIPDPFEEELLRLLGDDRPHPGDRSRAPAARKPTRVERAIAALRRAGFTFGTAPSPASPQSLRGSRLYVGYDSAGQHVAAACGVPLISIFAGFPVAAHVRAAGARTGDGCHVIRVDRPDPHETLARVREALAALVVPQRLLRFG